MTTDTAGLVVDENPKAAYREIFEGELLLSRPSLAIGRILDLPADRHPVSIDRDGPVRIQIRALTAVPVGTPTDLNVLVGETRED